MNLDSQTTAPLISMCICTYRRPEGIRRALTSLIDTDAPAGWNIEFIVVDNDAEHSASEVVAAVKASRPSADVHYFVETVPGVSHARNRCLNEANGSILTFIDDDEYVDQSWLVNLVLALETYKADAVFGPVIPEFSSTPPEWIELTGMHRRARFPTGSAVEWRNAQTNNVALRRSLLNNGRQFSVEFAKTGGEDSQFFAKASAEGHKFVWCDEAKVTEIVPAIRMTRRWALERAFNGGRTFVRLQANLVTPFSFPYYAIYGALFSLILIPPLIFNIIINNKKYMYYARRLAENLGKISSRFHGGGHYGG